MFMWFWTLLSLGAPDLWTTNVSMVTQWSLIMYILPLHAQSRFQVHLHYTWSSTVKQEPMCEAK